MAFKNEYTPLADQALFSAVLAEARQRFRLGYSKYDVWTVDYDRESALIHGGSDREPGFWDRTAWYFVDREGRYKFDTQELSRAALVADESGSRKEQDFLGFVRERSDLSSAEIAVTYKLLGFWGGIGWSEPSRDSLLRIKEALAERQRMYLFDLEAFSASRFTLIEGRSSTSQ